MTSAEVAAPRTEPDPPPVTRGADSVARGGLIALAGAVGNVVGGFALLALAGHWLGAARTGVVFGATAAFTVLFNTAKLGSDTALIRFASGLAVTHRTQGLRPLLRTALMPAALSSTVLGIVGLLFSGTWAGLLYADVPVSEGRRYVLLGAVFLPIAAISLVLFAFARGLGRVGPVVASEQLFKPLSRPLLLGIAVAFGGGTFAFYVSWLVPVAFGLVFAVLVVRKQLQSVPRSSEKVVQTREFWSFAGFRAVAGILDICAPWIGVLILSGVVSSTAAASFTAVTRLAMVGTVIMLALRLATSSHVGGAFARNDRRLIEDLQFSSTAWMVLTSWPFFLIAIAFPAPLLRIFGGDFGEGATALALVAAANLVNLAVGNAQITVLMSGHSAWNLIGAATAVTTQVAVGAVLIPQHGVTGAGWALAAAVVAENLVAYWQVRRGLRLRIWSPTVFLAAGTALVASASGIGVGYLVGHGLLAPLTAGVVALAVLSSVALRLRSRLLTDDFTTAFGQHRQVREPGSETREWEAEEREAEAAPGEAALAGAEGAAGFGSPVSRRSGGSAAEELVRGAQRLLDVVAMPMRTWLGASTALLVLAVALHATTPVVLVCGALAVGSTAAAVWRHRP